MLTYSHEEQTTFRPGLIVVTLNGDLPEDTVVERARHIDEVVRTALGQCADQVPVVIGTPDALEEYRGRGHGVLWDGRTCW